MEGGLHRQRRAVGEVEGVQLDPVSDVGQAVHRPAVRGDVHRLLAPGHQFGDTALRFGQACKLL
jgi:hypothetical protein